MKLNREQVLHIAKLARLDLSESDTERLMHDLTSILDYVDELRALDVSGVEPMSHAVAMATPERADVAQPWLTREQALSNTADVRDGLVVVPRIIGEAE